MPPPKSEFEAQMHHLEAEVRRLETEYNMFFAGRLKRPPFETKNRVAALMKRHDQSYIRNTGDRFRFESLQSRYQKFLELVERQMNNRELGRPILGVNQRPAATASKADHPPKTDPNVIKFTRDKQPSEDEVQKLFDRLAEAKKKVGEKPVAKDRLAALVKAQVDKFASEGKAVSFKISTKDGKVTLTAKAADEK